jgi:hypothetical protein
MPELYTLGALISPPDARDHSLDRYMPESLPPRPGQLDLRKCYQPVRNQGGIGSCVPTSLVSGLLGSKEVMAGQPDRILSVAAAYYGVLKAKGAPWNGEGVGVRECLDWLMKNGVGLESDQPYTGTAAPLAGPGPLYAQHAAMNRAGAYARVGQSAPLLTELMDAIYAHGGAELTIDVQPGFDAGHGIIKPGGTSRGQHAITAVGYDEQQRTILIRNSWGEGWGDGGYGLLSFEYVEQAHEAWALIDAAIVRDGTHPSNFPVLAYIADHFGWHISGINA